MKCRLPMRIGGGSSGGVNYVEWIKGDGSSYFDTGFKPNQNTRVVMKAKHPSTTTEFFLFGARNGYLNSAFDLRIRNNSAAWLAEYANKTASLTADYTQMQTVDFNKNVLKVGSVSTSFTAATFQCNYNLYLFALNNVGGAANIAPNLSVEQCQIYDNGTLVKDYRAAVDPDGVACFYEEISKAYEYGAGTFTAGASISGGGSGGGTTPKEYAVTLSGTFSSSYGYVTINGTKYTTATTVNVAEGTAVSVYVAGTYTNYDGLANVTLNGTKVQNGKGTYNHTVTSNCKITMSYSQSSYKAAITTE
ncbi:MAG: hypothetical protein J6S23_04310 [Clostridia bacterium]|nr:hypothetical protein [Clostridia bacterium]